MKMRNEQGFTLVEVVLGLALTAMVFVLLLSALRLGRNSQEKGLGQEELNQRVRILSDRLRWLVRGTYPYVRWSATGEAVLFFEGSEDSLRFVTTSVDAFSDGPEDIAGLKLVSLSVKDGGLVIGESVFFLEDAFEGQAEKEHVLDPGVTEMSVKYLDLGEPDEWLSSWDGQEKETPPAAVGIELTLVHEGRKIEVPPFVAAIRTASQPREQTAEEPL